MVSGGGTRALLKICYFLCFALLLVSSLASCMWLLLASMDWDWPIPRAILYVLCLFVAQIASLILYFNRPWVAVVTGWVDVLMIVVGVAPRNSTSLNSFFHQFMFDLVFLVAANGGLAAYFVLNRGKNGPDGDIVIDRTQSPHL